MSGFFDELLSGFAESRRKLADEAASAEKNQDAWTGRFSPSIDHVIVALASPYRASLTEGDPQRLFSVGLLSNQQTSLVRTHLQRVFRVNDDFSLQAALRVSDGFADQAFANAIQLHLIAAAADVGLIRFEDYRETGRNRLAAIVADPSIDSWRTYGVRVLAGDTLHDEATKQRLSSSVDDLLADASSPWRMIDWPIVRALGGR